MDLKLGAGLGERGRPANEDEEPCRQSTNVQIEHSHSDCWQFLT